MDVQIESRNVDMTPRWREEIEVRVADLQAGRKDITHVRVTLDRNTHHKKKDDAAEAVIVIQIPGRTLTARKRAESFEEAYRDAFEAIDIELEKYREKLASHDVRLPPIPARGVIGKLLRDEGYGFIIQDNGEEVYFHRNAVKDMAFEDLDDGMEVTFNVEMGDKGPQATRVNSVPVIPEHKANAGGSVI